MFLVCVPSSKGSLEGLLILIHTHVFIMEADKVLFVEDVVLFFQGHPGTVVHFH